MENVWKLKTMDKRQLKSTKKQINGDENIVLYNGEQYIDGE